MTDLLQVFLLSMTPIGELRLAIPVGLAVYRLDIVSVFFAAVIGNLIPVIILLVFLRRFSEYASEKSGFFRNIFSWWENNTRKKHYENIQKYGILGLILFVAIPFPLTGAWTGALLATLMNLPLKKSLPAIFMGIVSAGFIVSILVVSGINIGEFLGWQIFTA